MPTSSNGTTTAPEIERIARRHGFGVEAAEAMRNALVRGGGRMAQFDHPEFSGPGQWMQGGMTMVSDLFDTALKRRVDGLATELSEVLDGRTGTATSSAYPGRSANPALAQATGDASRSFVVPTRRGAVGPSWPVSLGVPGSTGAQNGVRYAVFGATRRLAIERDGQVTVYDTGEHRIGGVSQQQGGPDPVASLRFTSQHGMVDLGSLPVVSCDDAQAVPTARPRSREGDANRPASGARVAEIAATLETLADLKRKGILDADEFDAKKVELLARI